MPPAKKPAVKKPAPAVKKTPVKAKGRPAPNTKAPPGSYALPAGGPGGAPAYPVDTPGRAKSALSRVAANGTPAEKAKVRAAVRKKHPSLPSSQGKGQSAAAKAKPRSGK